VNHTPYRPCPVCAGDLSTSSHPHCPAVGCTWRQCLCGALVGGYGLWIAPTPR